MFAGWDDEKKAYADKSSWNYELDGQGFAKVDPTLAHPRSVFQVMKRFYSRYTPDAVSNICGCSADDFVKAAELITSTHTPDRVGTIMYALGWTHHSHSVQLIHAAAMLQLLLGNIGRPGGGLNALRGHANIQGGTDCGMAYHNLPGYIAIPKADHESLASFIGAVTPKPLRPNSTNFWSNTDRFVVSQLKAYYGAAATPDNEFGYAMHPRLPQSAPGAYENWSWAYIFDHMYRGDMEGFFSFGMNPVSNGPHSRKAIAALAKLKWMVVAENFEQETASFWRPDILALVDLKPEDVKTEVFLLPAANFAEKDGSFVNSARWIQWKWKAVDPPGEARADQEIVARIFLKVRELYEQEGGTFPDPVRNLNWWYSDPVRALARRGLQGAQRLGAGGRARSGRRGRQAAGQQLAGFLEPGRRLHALRQLALHRDVHRGGQPTSGDRADPSGLGRFQGWTVSWPANRRVIYNRGSADAQGSPGTPRGAESRGTGPDGWATCRTARPTLRPPERDAFVVLPEGVARLWAPGHFADGPFPEHYEAVEQPVANPLHPAHLEPGGESVFTTDQDFWATRDKFTIVCTTFRLTEHFHYWTKHLAPTSSFSRGSSWRSRKGCPGAGHRQRGRVRVITPRGPVEGGAIVTRPIRRGRGQGHVAGRIPIHWGSAGTPPGRGPLANLLTASAVDPNTLTPEYKTFLVKLERVRRERLRWRSGALRVFAAATDRSVTAADGLEVHRHLDLHRLQGLRGGVPGVERPGAPHDAATDTYQTMP